jgi:eukaryotic-like serine/threonine-protein kinase
VSAATSSDRFPRLEKYELLAEIGHGGMATVYRARDRRLDREVAVKIIHKHLRENPEVRRRFVAEAKAVAKLRHPGIVEVYDVSADDEEERFLVVELIRGTTLRKLLDEHGSLPPEIGAIVTRMLCDAVGHAHDTSVIHRDIKPENVLVDLPARASSPGPSQPGSDKDASSRGHARIKLTDFGIAKVLDAQGVTSTGQILGSPAHMAPEQIEGGDVGPQTDVFALGVLMYECMVGHLPFVGGNPAQVLRRVLEGVYEPADSERPEVGGRWASILARALDIDPTRRLQTATELAALIDAELSAVGLEDPRRWLDEYFADPDGLRERLVSSLVPRLIARGERGRRAGDVPGAAADFNRALALKPDDLAILRRVSSLTAERQWKRRGGRIAVIALGAGLLGAGSYGATRALRPVLQPTGQASSSTVATTASGEPGPAPPPSGEVSARPVPSGAPSGVQVEPVASTSAVVPVTSASGRGEAVRPRGLRRVQLAAVPPGAHLKLDGVEFSWFGAVKELAPGPHRVEGFMPENSPAHACCSPASQTVNITDPPAGAPDELQTFTIALTFKDATAVLGAGAPDGARVTCASGMVFGKQSPGTQKMYDTQKQTSCTFTPGNRQSTVTFKAGETVTVPWPG